MTDSKSLEPVVVDQQMPDVPLHNPTELGALSVNGSTNDTSANADGRNASAGTYSDASDAANASVQKIYLRDYVPPAYTVEDVYLDICLFDEYAEVDSVLKMQRQPSSAQRDDLVLLGADIELLSLTMNDKVLNAAHYRLDSAQLIIPNAPDMVTLNIKVRHKPQKNTALEGLYVAGEGAEAMFVTQCEPEGFRKITYYPDRPDVLATFTTRLEADKKFPTLLANGDLIEAGMLSTDNRRHYAIWRDPIKKPSYLFACVFADLSVLTDSYTTIEGREVKLEIYAKAYDIDKCDLAMQALKDAMQWDEVHYGRAYDLDRYMIVAVSQFNMGAMENKGLNIFNTACVLASPDTTTDARSFSVKAIIAHEYFHNWTGNRITCRDWFQLCLKEGLTVYRDQSFSADQQSPAVQRIDDVATLRAHQFSEDAGPLAHPPRPDSFVEINNFYTATVYEKGAEIVRMLANTLGEKGYRQGTDTYFERYDGQAVTVEDWLSALSAGDVSVEHFIDWYTQPGTPEVTGKQDFDTTTKTLTVTLSQSVRDIEGFSAPKQLPIPIAAAIFDRSSGKMLAEQLLMLSEKTQTFRFTDVHTVDTYEPVLSLLRDFSAPVQLNYHYSEADLAFLLAHETSGFNQWQNAQALVNQILLQDHNPAVYLAAVKTAFLAVALNGSASYDAMLASRLLDIPAERELATAIHHDYQPEVMRQKRQALKQQVAQAMAQDWQGLYQQLPIVAYEDTPEARGQRALRNVVLDMALAAGMTEATEWAKSQYINANCMTERLGALQAMVHYNHSDKAAMLADFYQRFNRDALVIDLWFGVQAGDQQVSATDIEALLAHQDFDWGTPNRVRAVVGNFAAQPTKLWTKEGLAIYTAVVARLDNTNPVLASRLLQALSRWYTLAEPVRSIAKTQLHQLRESITSKNTQESLQSLLKAG